MLAVVQKAEIAAPGRQRARPPARLLARFKHMHLGFIAQMHRRRQARPARANHGDFRARLMLLAQNIHGLNPNSQVFRAMRFLRGPGMAILYFNTFCAPSRSISLSSA